MFENVDRRTTDFGVTGILIAHLRAFGSGELKICVPTLPKIFRPITRNTLIFYLALFLSFI